MGKYCHSCKFYDEDEKICTNDKAFSINKDYPTLRSFDSECVVIKGIDLERLMIPSNFGCIHHEEQKPNYKYDYDEDDDFEDEPEHESYRYNASEENDYYDEEDED